MKKDQVLSGLCEISSQVGDHFKNQLPADCFCNEDSHFQFDEKILNFIREAVQEKITKET